MVHQAGPQERIQPDQDRSRRQVEDSISNQAGTIRVYSNAIWID